MTKRIIGLLLGTVLAISLVGAIFQQAPDLFQKALRMERSEGDLKGAIALYERVVAEAADEALAAKAQLRIGFCYEALGLKEAAKAFQAVIDRYPSQSEAVNVAREKLSSIGSAKNGGQEKRDKFYLERIWEGRDVDTSGDVSPDGRSLCFVDWATGDLAVRDIQSGSNKRLTDKGPWTKSEEFPLFASWSPDGKRIAYIWFNGKYFDLRIWDIDAEASKIVYADEKKYPMSLYGWSQDGKSLLADRIEAQKIFEIGFFDIESGEFSAIIESKEWPHPSLVRLSPDGLYLAYSQLQDPDNMDIYIYEISSKRVITHIKYPGFENVLGWTPDGKTLLFLSDRRGVWDLWALPIVEGRSLGEPVLVHENAGDIDSMGMLKDGRLFFGIYQTGRDIYTAEIDFRTGKFLSKPRKINRSNGGENANSIFSSNGELLAFTSSQGPRSPISRLQSNMVCIYDMKSHAIRNFPADVSIPSFLNISWSTDEKYLNFIGRDDLRKNSLYSMDVSSGEMKKIFSQEDVRESISAWSCDLGTVYLVRIERIEGNKRISKILQHEVKSGIKKEIYSVEDFPAFLQLTLSPDGKKIAFKRTEGSAGERVYSLYVLDNNGGTARKVLTDKYPVSFYSLSWAPDSEKIFLTKRIEKEEQIITHELWLVPINGDESQKIDLDMYWLQDVSLHPDGKTIAFTAGPTPKSEVWVMGNFLSKTQK